MEFLRFGSSIPGEYWGCCAFDIIQNFKHDPDKKASIQLVNGDAACPIMRGNDMLFAGPTYRDIFLQRLRIGTFSSQGMPNHGFLAIMSDIQLCSQIGNKWLALLKEQGFEFIRSVSNSVWTGSTLGKPSKEGSNLNHLFGLFRNIGQGGPSNPFEAPKQWTELPQVIPEAYKLLSTGTQEEISEGQHKAHTKLYEELPKKLLTEKEIEEAKAPVMLSGLRSLFPPQVKEERLAAIAIQEKTTGVKNTDPFGLEEAEQDYEDDYYGDNASFETDWDIDEDCGDPDCNICNTRV